MLKKSLSIAAMLALMTGTIDARGMGQGHGYGKYQNANAESRQFSKSYRYGSQNMDRYVQCSVPDVNNSTTINTTFCNIPDVNNSTTTNANTTFCDIFDVNNSTTTNTTLSTLSEELANTLSYMGNEERLAHDVYSRLYNEWRITQFSNIIPAEYEHIKAVQQLVQKYKLNDDINFTNVDLPALGYKDTAVENMQAGTYDISKIQRLYDDLVAQGSTSEIDALRVACTVEVVDITDLDRDIAIAESESATDIVATFNYLRDGSYSHYWAFDEGLKNRGVTEGCCSLGTVDGINYCHPEYPQNGNGNGRR